MINRIKQRARLVYFYNDGTLNWLTILVDAALVIITVAVVTAVILPEI